MVEQLNGKREVRHLFWVGGMGLLLLSAILWFNDGANAYTEIKVSDLRLLLEREIKATNEKTMLYYQNLSFKIDDVVRHMEEIKCELKEIKLSLQER